MDVLAPRAAAAPGPVAILASKKAIRIHTASSRRPRSLDDLAPMACYRYCSPMTKVGSRAVGDKGNYRAYEYASVSGWLEFYCVFFGAMFLCS